MARKKAHFTFYASENGRDGWKLVPPAEVPAWVLDPDILGNLANGNMAMDAANGSLWFRADVKLAAQDQARLDAAKRARDEREARKLLQLPADRPLLPEASVPTQMKGH